jgi:hypothetical protein
VTGGDQNVSVQGHRRLSCDVASRSKKEPSMGKKRFDMENRHLSFFLSGGNLKRREVQIISLHSAKGCDVTLPKPQPLLPKVEEFTAKLGRRRNGVAY